MNNQLEKSTETGRFATPIKITNPEPWQWDVLAKAFLNDDVMNFWVGKKCNEQVLKDFFEAVIRDTLESGGAVFASSDKKVVLTWKRLESDLEVANKWKDQWYKLLDAEGVERYNWLYGAGDLSIDPADYKKYMIPDYMGVLPEAQCLGYGSHILKWTLNYFDELGYQIPFLVASSRRSAKLYGPLIGFRIHKEVMLFDDQPDQVAVFMVRTS